MKMMNSGFRMILSKTLSNAEIIAAVIVNEKMPEINKNINNENILQTPKILHSEGLKALKTSFQHFEQDVLVLDLLFLHCLRDEVAECRE
ncbi:hypothetical protein TNCV_4390731 [Trichonephila clavipes]|nr:hypothetical protein TNCV_4390731 [Trichonephila clavipes]